MFATPTTRLVKHAIFTHVQSNISEGQVSEWCWEVVIWVVPKSASVHMVFVFATKYQDATIVWPLRTVQKWSENAAIGHLIRQNKGNLPCIRFIAAIHVEQNSTPCHTIINSHLVLFCRYIMNALILSILYLFKSFTDKSLTWSSEGVSSYLVEGNLCLFPCRCSLVVVHFTLGELTWRLPLVSHLNTSINSLRNSNVSNRAIFTYYHLSLLRHAALFVIVLSPSY